MSTHGNSCRRQMLTASVAPIDGDARRDSGGTAGSGCVYGCPGVLRETSGGGDAWRCASLHWPTWFAVLGSPPPEKGELADVRGGC